MLRKGKLVDRTRRLDLSRQRRAKSRALRVRFREPPDLRGVAYLIVERAGKPAQAWRYDPQRRRSSRITAPRWDEEVAGTGLSWADLRGALPGGVTWSYRGESRLKVPARSKSAKALRRRVLVIEGTRAGARRPTRRVHVDRTRYVPWLTQTLDGKGKVTKLRWERDHRRVGDRLRPFEITIAEPGRERLSRVTVERRAVKVPKAHLDPNRYWQE